MNINGINVASAVTRIAAPGAGSTAAATAAAARSPGHDAVQTEEADNKPTPVHFPWLSRLSAGLEAASNKRAPFSTQIMGDNVNNQA